MTRFYFFIGTRSLSLENDRKAKALFFCLYKKRSKSLSFQLLALSSVVLFLSEERKENVKSNRTCLFYQLRHDASQSVWSCIGASIWHCGQSTQQLRSQWTLTTRKFMFNLSLLVFSIKHSFSLDGTNNASSSRVCCMCSNDVSKHCIHSD